MPPTAPVIPENPALPAEYEVAILDDSGSLVTQEDAFLLPVGYKATLSAWSKEDAISYQWQICYDKENNLWVDIADQNRKGLLFSHALFAGLTEEDGGDLRCVVKTAGGEVISEPITGLLIDAPAENGVALMSVRARENAASYAFRKDAAALMAVANDPAVMAETPSMVTITLNYLEAKNSTPLWAGTAT